VEISPQDIKQKQFKVKFRGFDMADVDSFLEEITEQMETLLREKEAAEDENARLKERVEEYKANEKSLRDTLMAAQKITEDMKESARKEAELRLKDAETEVDKMLNDARRKLASLQEEISEMNRIKERFALKVRGLIEDHLRMLNYEEREEAETK
jgi:cell division initiation protein